MKFGPARGLMMSSTCDAAQANVYEAANPDVWPTLEGLVDRLTRGDPESPLRWMCKSTHVLAAEMFTEYGIRIVDVHAFPGDAVGKAIRTACTT